MIPHIFFYQLVWIALVWLFFMLHYAWPSRGAPGEQRPAAPIKPPRQRSKEPTPCAGLTHKPPCAACAHDTPHPKTPPPVPPKPMPSTNRRPRASDTSRHFCPHATCDYRGWVGWGNLRANGHPGGGPWRQLQCPSCKGYFPEHHGPICYGTRVPVELIVHGLACLAEGLGIRATARVFAVAPNTVLGWLLEAAEHLKALSRDVLCDVPMHQVQLEVFRPSPQKGIAQGLDGGISLDLLSAPLTIPLVCCHIKHFR
jgi:hypothetical protein